MTCAPYCDICGGNLGHHGGGDWICAKCKSINDRLAPKPLSETRKADRLIMAERLAAAMLEAGATQAQVEPCGHDSHRIDIRISAPGGAHIHVDFDGRSPQPNVHVATWNTERGVFLSPILGDVNPYHYGKLNVVGHGLDSLIAQLASHLGRFVDGTGYLARDDRRVVAMGERYKARGWSWPLT